MDTADDSLSTLFEQLRTGSSREREEAFRQLFERLHPRLYRYFLKRGSPPQEAQDFTQETLLGIYRGMGSLRNEKGVEPWLFQIARNAYLLGFRRKSADKRSGIEVPIEAAENQASAAVHPTSPLDQALERERRRLLHEAIQELPKQMRDCMTLRIHDDLSYHEIALVLDLSVETVKAHLYQARRRLQQKLGSHFQAPLEKGS